MKHWRDMIWKADEFMAQPGETLHAVFSRSDLESLCGRLFPRSTHSVLPDIGVHTLCPKCVKHIKESSK